MSPEQACRLASRCGIIERSPVRDIFEMAERMTGLLRLEVGEPDFPTPAEIVEAGVAALRRGDTRYTSSNGIPSLREAVSDRYQSKHHLAVDLETEVMISTGGAAALYLALLATTEPGDEILLPDPGWPQYQPLVVQAGGVPLRYQLGRDTQGRFVLDPRAVAERLTSRTRSVVLNFPSNPTGGLLEAEAATELGALVADRELFVLADEVYEELVYDGHAHLCAAGVAGLAGRTVVVGSASKSYAMTGWRIGHAVGPASIIAEMAKFQSLITICPNAAAQAAYAAALRGAGAADIRVMVAEYQARRDFCVAALNSIPGMACASPSGAFYVFPDVSAFGLTDSEFSRRLLTETGVTSVPGSAFGPAGAQHIRFSYAASLDCLEEAFARLASFVAGLEGVRER